MDYAIEQIAETLKEARARKELSQRALSTLAGLPQSHISKIENGAVDLRLSSLIELARVLDLELTLIPRNAAIAVNARSYCVRNCHSDSYKSPSHIKTIAEVGAMNDVCAKRSASKSFLNWCSDHER